MKKVLCLILALAISFCFTACSDNDGSEDTSVENNTNAEGTTAITNATSYDNGMTETFDQMEYAAYIDLFNNQNYSDYENKTMTKKGNLGTILTFDANGDEMIRYYVWGYADETKCCCYQWEFVAPEDWKAPANGSIITVKGTLVASDDALDGYWFDDCDVTVDDKFTESDIDYDMTRISHVLAYVQNWYLINYADYFDGVSLRLYGRALTVNTIQDPYWDEYWNIDFLWDGDKPSIGQYIVLDGTLSKQETEDSSGNTSVTGIIKATGVQLLDE